MSIAMAKHILVKDQSLAEDIKKKLAKGGDFEKLAKKHSTCNSAKKGGDLGEIKRGNLVKPIEQVVFKQALKKIHGPIKTKFGFHLVYVYFRD